MEELRQIDTVVGIAGGEEKREAIRGALNGGFIDLLITDNYTAEELV
jgi:DNA-binding transcriptional regulator LsrR (DeoR family)